MASGLTIFNLIMILLLFIAIIVIAVLYYARIEELFRDLPVVTTTTETFGNTANPAVSIQTVTSGMNVIVNVPSFTFSASGTGSISASTLKLPTPITKTLSTSILLSKDKGTPYNAYASIAGSTLQILNNENGVYGSSFAPGSSYSLPAGFTFSYTLTTS